MFLKQDVVSLVKQLNALFYNGLHVVLFHLRNETV